MPTIRIPLDEAIKKGKVQIRLPEMCMVCGEKDCEWRQTEFHTSYRASDTHSVHRSLSLKVPLCREHEKHFAGQAWIGILALIGFVAGFLGVVIGMTTGIYVVTFVGVALAIPSVIGAVIAMALLKRTMIHATVITDDDVTLANLGEEFAEAVLKMNERARRIEEGEYKDYDDDYGEDDDDRGKGRRARGRGRRDEDGDDPGRRRGRRDDDDDDDDDDRGRRRGRR